MVTLGKHQRPAYVEKTWTLKFIQARSLISTKMKAKEELNDVETSQQILTVFADAFCNILNDADLKAKIQKVKAALFNRDYLEAFGNQENLEAYIVKWSPSRALSYFWFLKSLNSISRNFLAQRDVLRVMSIGGGAGAEVCAFGAMAYGLGSRNRLVQPTTMISVDIADWGLCLDKLVGEMSREWKAPAQDTDMFALKFVCKDALKLEPSDVDFSNIDIITSFFTINELFAENKGGTVKFLQKLNQCRKGTIFIFLDSAGSYSDLKVGNSKFPVYFLIDHTLTKDKSWEIVEHEDGKWFRLPEGLSYPWKLENMRYLFRVYRKN